MTERTNSSNGDKRKPNSKKLIEIVCSQRYNSQPLRKRQRAKITKIWDNPFFFRASELMMSTMIAGIFIESSLPLEGYVNLALHTGICGPIIPIFALFSSSTMLDRNPKSDIAMQALLATSACLYMMTVFILGVNWPLFSKNRTKYRIALVSMVSLASIVIILLLVDLAVPWIVRCCKVSKCCSKSSTRKKKEQGVPQATKVQPPA